MNVPIKIIINVLDDQEYILALIKEVFFDISEYTITCFTDPIEFEKAFNSNVDLVISDVRVGSGFDVLETIKEINDESPSTYIIIMSAFFDVPFMQKLMRLRVNDTVVKTGDMDWLLDLKNSVMLLHDKLRGRAEIKSLMFNR